MFGATHRYGTGIAGTEATLKGFTVQDLKSFHASMYQPGNAVLLVVGDVTADAIVPAARDAVRIVERHERRARTPVPQAPQLAQGQITIVDMPGAEQSQIRIGWVGVPRSTPDYFTIEVLNTILGGSFTSRLNQNLREEHQYSYGASSRFDMRLSAGAFQAGAGVQTDKTAEALKEFFNELNGILKPVPRRGADQGQELRGAQLPQRVRDERRPLVQDGGDGRSTTCPIGYFGGYVDNLQKVTAAAVQKVAATYIQPKRFAVVVVGDRKVIEPGIRALNLGPVRVMSVDEAVGP